LTRSPGVWQKNLWNQRVDPQVANLERSSDVPPSPEPTAEPSHEARHGCAPDPQETTKIAGIPPQSGSNPDAEATSALWLEARSRLPRALTRSALQRPVATIVGWLLALVLIAPGLLELRVDTSTDSVLDRDGREWTIYQESQDRFGGDELIVVAIRGDAAWSSASLDDVARLADRLESLEGVARVDAVSTLPVIDVDAEGTLHLDPAYEPDRDDAVQRARRLAARDRILPRSLVSEDGRTFAVNLILEPNTEGRHAELLDAVHALADPIGARVSGVPVFRVEANRRTGREILTFAPLTAVVIAGFLTWMFRSMLAVLGCLLPGLVGVWVSVAAMGWLGVSLSISTMVLPSTILALGCAYAMHVLTAATRGPATDDPADDPGRALGRSLDPVALPIALSGLTTAVGFLSLALVRIEVVWATGLFGALGVLAVSLATLTLLPAMLSLRPLPARPTRLVESLRGPLAATLTRLAERRAGVVGGAWMLLAGAVAVGLFSLQVETDATRWLPIGHPVRDAYESIRVELSGISPMNVLIERHDGGSVLEPDTLAAIDGLTAFLDDQVEVGKAISVADPLRQIHGGFSEDARQPLPGDRALAEQYMLMLESVELMGDVVEIDRSAANVLLRVDDNGSAQLMDVAERARSWWKENAPDPEAVTATPTGIMYEFARAEEAIAYGQLRGLALAFAVISAILFAIFRWPRLAAVALVPNAVPLVIIFGVMGLLGVPLDAGTVVMGSLALGIAVDDTIHVTTTFCVALGEGLAPVDALRRCLGEVLPAVAASTLMLTAAFGIFALSEFAITRNLGWLTGSVMVLCLLADVTLLAVLLLRLPTPPTALRGKAASNAS